MRHFILARQRMNLSVVAISFAMSLPAARLPADDDPSLWDMQSLGAPPATEPADMFGATGVQAVFFAGEPWQGKPTKVFAYYGLPAGASRDAPVPGVVCVHGGSGTAFAEWVKIWNQHGFAAIALDTNGAVPKSIEENPDDFRHAWAGPRRYGFDTRDAPVRDQWPYHAVAAIIRAHSLLRSMPEVEADNVGLTGISWGGYLTCLTAGVDSRFKFAVPVYGCGFLDDGSSWVDAINQYGHDEWMRLWDPSSYLASARMPMLWVNGTNDAHYHLGPYQRTYRLPFGPRQLAIRVRMGHGHGAGWRPPEIYTFAKAEVGRGAPLVQIAQKGCENRQAWIQFQASSDVQVASAELNYTADSGVWVNREWKTVPAQLDAANHRATAAVPDGATVYYFNVADNRGLLVSSEHVELNAATTSTSSGDR